MKGKTIKFKHVYFDLPFLNFVKDSMDDPTLRAWADAFQKGDRPLPYSPYAPHSEKPGTLILGGGFPVYLPPDMLADYYLISLPSIQVGLRLLRRVNPHRSTTLMGEVPGDRAGRASFSTAKVMFDPRTIKIGHHWNMELFVKLSIDAINKFISHYRVIADRPYIQPVTPQVIQDFIIETAFDDGASQTQQYGTGSGPLHGMGGAISDEQDQALRSAIQGTSPPAIYATLDADVRDHLDLRNWRLALIEAAVLFEAWLTNFLRDRYKGLGLSERDIEDKFVSSSGWSKGITQMADQLVVDATNLDFAQTDECANWKSKVRDLRNDVVHGKKFDVTPREASEAYTAVCNAMRLLDTASK